MEEEFNLGTGLDVLEALVEAPAEEVVLADVVDTNSAGLADAVSLRPPVEPVIESLHAQEPVGRRALVAVARRESEVGYPSHGSLRRSAVWPVPRILPGFPAAQPAPEMGEHLPFRPQAGWPQRSVPQQPREGGQVFAPT